MKNTFLGRANQGTTLEDALRVSQQLMDAKNKMPYASGSKKDIGAGLKSFSKKVYTSFNGKKEKCTITKKAFKKGYLVEVNNKLIRVKNDNELYRTLIIEGK